MNYEQALETIRSRSNFSLEPTLDRITKVLDVLGNPQEKFSAIHIAGTNGKGSTAAMCASVLKEQGFKTGLFISPYIIDFRERIQMNNEFIDKESLAYLTKQVADTNIELTEFEFVTAIGFLYFAEQNCDIAVIETGLGGRLDATNTLPKSSENISVITKIGLDHTSVLGDTIEQIAKEKCGIVTKKTVMFPIQEKSVAEIIAKSSEKLIVPDLEELKIIESDVFSNTFIYKGKKYEISLGGKHQILNAVTAIEALKNTALKIDDTAIFEGLKKTFFPARLEVANKNPLLIIDGAHNPDGANVLKDAMSSYGGKITAIVGMLKDKDCESFLETVIRSCDEVLCVSVPYNPRSMSGEELSELAQKYCNKVKVSDSIESALQQVRNSQNTVFVFGSLYLASAVREYIPKIFENLQNLTT